MRELIYLSERKLRQFVLGRPRRWRNRAQVEAEIKFPGIGGVKVGPAVPDRDAKVIPDLEKVISALESSDRAARWFADDDLQPGQWVHFEAPLTYSLLSDGMRYRAVVFIDRDEPTTGYPTGGTTRLLMHGSAEHLLGTVNPSTAREDAHLTSYTELRMFARLLYALARRSASTEAELDVDDWKGPAENDRRYLKYAIS